jgi:hypothetical protein
MKITFKEIDEDLSNEVFVDDTYVGTIAKDIWSGKWTMRPDFNHFSTKNVIKKMKYDSFYKAGKALAKLYEDTFIFFDEDEDTDTQEFDMRGIFKQRGP